MSRRPHGAGAGHSVDTIAMNRTPGTARWFTHGWNRELSWNLIVSIIPRIPPPLRPPIHLATTLLCFTVMHRERRAARRNLQVISGGHRLRLFQSTFKLFYNFSKFMVAYTEPPPYGDGSFAERVANREQGRALVQQALSGGRGLFVLGMHLGQWDLALIALSRLGHPITAVMRREDEDAARFAAAARRAAGIRVAYAAEDPRLLLRLLGSLRRNEIVALQGDRPYGGRSARCRLFDRDTAIAAGPMQLARASGAPILPAVLVFEGHRRYRMVFGDLLRPDHDRPQEEIDEALEGPVAAALESLIRRYPDQWFNFYDYWNGGAQSDGRSPGHARPAPQDGAGHRFEPGVSSPPRP